MSTLSESDTSVVNVNDNFADDKIRLVTREKKFLLGFPFCVSVNVPAVPSIFPLSTITS